MEGRGVLIYANGARYEGEFKQDKYHGIGTLYFHDGSVFSGLWFEGIKNGKGLTTFQIGDKYEAIYD